MPRAGLTPESVIDGAARIADAEGLDAVTLARLATELGVRPPSLYKHVDGLDSIRRGLALRGIEEANRRLQRATIGKSRDDALFALADAYWQFARDRPGLYAASLRAAKPGEKDVAAAERRPPRHGARRALRLRRARRGCAPRDAWPSRHHPRLRFPRRRGGLSPQARPRGIVPPALVRLRPRPCRAGPEQSGDGRRRVNLSSLRQCRPSRNCAGRTGRQRSR